MAIRNINAKPEKEIYDSLHPLLARWFKEKFKGFAPSQKYSLVPIKGRRNILISAPTGSGKTLSAFASILSHLVDLDERKELEDRVYAIYISPLKALSSDIHHNLITPLEELSVMAGRKLGIRVGLRTGDTDVKERAKQARKAPHILVTTPESLAIMINSPKFSLNFDLLEFVIIDEIHSLAENKRGVHMSLTLERLQELSRIEFCRIGLSATISPLDKVAQFLVGSDRDCDIAEVEMEKAVDLKLKCPVLDFLDTNTIDFSEKLYKLLNDEVEKHKTTLIFTNTRAATERVVNTLKERYPKTYLEGIESEEEIEKEEKIEEKNEEKNEEKLEKEWDSFGNIANESDDKVDMNKEEAEKLGFDASALKDDKIYEKFMKTEMSSVSNIGAHHASLSKEHRFDIENRLREGKLKVVVCSTSLELGIDIGYIDLVVLLSSPKAVSRALQRIGRAGHQLGGVPHGVFIVNDFDDLVECAIILKNAKERKIDSIHIPDNCLDILSQHIFGMAIGKIWKVDEMYKMIKRSYCYRDLTRGDFFSVVSYLAGEYELEDSYVYAKIWYDAEKGEIGKRGKLARVLYMTNIGTIPSESFVSVICGDRMIGKVDELFLEKMRKGDVFVLGGNRYMYTHAKGMNIYVRSAEGRKPTIPSWFSEMLPLSFDTACAIGKLRKLVNDKLEHNKTDKEITDFISEYCYVEENEAEIIFEYMKNQFAYSIIPHENRILIEEYTEKNLRDYVEGRKNAGKKFVVFHTLYGRRVNDVLSRAVAYGAARVNQRDVEVGISDNGFFVAGENISIDKAEKIFKQINPKNLREIISEAIESTEVLKRRFRHCAARGLMILRNYKGRTKSVGKQQMSSHFLLASVRKKTKDFPILKEARREVLEDLMDIKNAELVLKWIEDGKVKVEKKNTRIVSPFAVGLLLQAHSDMIKIEDKIAFIKRIYKELKERD